METKIVTKRAYLPASADDGFRVYVDRLWPRGLSHDTFRYDLWNKDVAPSAELRRWFHHDPSAQWPEFEKRYTDELLRNPAFNALKALIAQKPKVTLLYSSRNEEQNNALVLQRLLSA